MLLVIEMFIVAPFELILSRENYARLNRYLMGFIFFIPLWVISSISTRVELIHLRTRCAISLWETHFDHSLRTDYLALLSDRDEYTSGASSLSLS